VLFEYFKAKELNLPNSWFWDQGRILSNNYTASDTKPIYYFQEVKPRSKEEIYLNQLKEKLDFEGLKFDKSYALVTPELAVAISIARKVQSSRMKENPSQFFNQTWKNFPDLEIRQEIINCFQQKLYEWEWNVGLTLDCSPILPVVHGTDKSIALKIAQGGFASLSTLDDGYYGKGIYFSTSAKYIIPYYATKKNPTILICLIIPGNVYPITEFPQSNNIRGLPLVNGYQSHYCVTTKGGIPFTRQDYEEQKMKYDEVVIGQETQVVPLFLLEMKRKYIEKIFQEWRRDELRNI